MNKKVFCMNCKYFKKCDVEVDVWYECRAEYKIKYTPTHSYRSYANPMQKNKNNDCKDFEPNLITRIFHRKKSNSKE